MSYETKQDAPIIDAFTVYHYEPEKAHPDFDIDLARQHHKLETQQDYDKLRSDSYYRLMTS